MVSPKYRHILYNKNSKAAKKTTLFMPWNSAFIADNNIFPGGGEGD